MSELEVKVDQQSEDEEHYKKYEQEEGPAFDSLELLVIIPLKLDPYCIEKGDESNSGYRVAYGQDVIHGLIKTIELTPMYRLVLRVINNCSQLKNDHYLL